MLVLGWEHFWRSLMLLNKSLIFLVLLLVSSSSILAFRFSFFLFLKCLPASFLTFFRLCNSLCIQKVYKLHYWEVKSGHVLVTTYLELFLNKASRAKNGMAWKANENSYNSNIQPKGLRRFDFLTAELQKTRVFRDVTPFRMSNPENDNNTIFWYVWLYSLTDYM